VKLLLYEHLEIQFDWQKSTGRLYINSSSFLTLEQIKCLNKFIHLLEFKVKEIKTLLQLFCMEYIWSTYATKM